jgi:P-type Ca2+ transporter type 2C
MREFIAVINGVSVKTIHIESIQGVDEKNVSLLQQEFGKNIFHLERSPRIIHILLDIVRDPMFILLFIACGLYFVLGQTDEGLMMIVAIVFVSGISVYQEVRSTKALEALKQFTEPKVIVVRSGKEKIIATDELVPGDVILLSEGNKVPADAVILRQNDLTVNESIITGESLPAEKNETAHNNLLYQGTTINSGQSYARVTAIGNNTVLGKLGKDVSTYNSPKTLLQLQVGRFVKRLALFGFTAFVIILILNFIKSQNAFGSLLFALTLAMAVIPEEIPVAFSSFMALGAYHMAKLGIISRQPQTIENLGAVNVICLDKTGTITENSMQVKIIYDYKTDSLINLEEVEHITDGTVLRWAVLASEAHPFDPMEKAIWKAYDEHIADKFSGLKMINEYPLQGQPPMMTHVYEHENAKLVAAKGAPERILKICRLYEDNEEKIRGHIRYLATKGFRVIGIASAHHADGPLPAEQDDFNWKFKGLLSFYDPPKKNIAVVFKKFYDAKIAVKLITGDFAETATNIAEQVGMLGYLKYYTGDEVIKMNEAELRVAVKTVNIFARMFPDAKLKVINALKANGEIVAMTGDGVNDASALKSAHIGIAMGEKGTELVRQAADLIITNDDLEKIGEAIEQGRKIFSNLKKAIRYIISIHIPIILTASLPLLLGWKYPNIFTPIHIIFLELIMGPTCSIFFEREPVEEDIMLRYPRSKNTGLFSNDELLISIVQGLIIAAGILTLYYIFMNNGHELAETRTVVFTTLIISNVFLTFVNRSFTKTFATTIRYKNNLAMPVVVISVLFLCSFLLVPFVRNLFELSAISTNNFLVCLATAFISVTWFEVYKLDLKSK